MNSIRSRISLAIAALLIFPSYAQANQAPPSAQTTSPIASKVNIQALVKSYQPPDYNTDVLRPLQGVQHQEALVYAKQQAEARQEALEASEESAKVSAVDVKLSTPTPPQVPSYGGLGVLTGNLGYSDPDGNCVDQPGVNNPGYGNPIDWPILYSTPHIGSTVLFTFNHTAVVVGIWSSGYIEVDQENAPGMTHTIPPSMVRGYR